MLLGVGEATRLVESIEKATIIRGRSSSDNIGFVPGFDLLDGLVLHDIVAECNGGSWRALSLVISTRELLHTTFDAIWCSSRIQVTYHGC